MKGSVAGIRSVNRAASPVGTPQLFPIVGIGASAGGLEAFSELLRGLPQKTGMAFVLVQHLDPSHSSDLREILARITKIPVQQVADGVVVRQDHIYVIPPNTSMALKNGVLGLAARVLTRGQHMPIDQGPDWKGDTPAGVKQVFHSATQFSAAAYRTQLFGPKDMPNVQKIQAGYKVQALSQFLKQPAPPAAPAIDFPPFTKDDMKMPFPKFLNFVLQFCPDGPEEKELRARLATIGIAAGKPFELDKLSEAQKAELALGLKEGYDGIEKRRNEMGKEINGWRIGASFGDRSFYHGDYLLRAAAALAGIYGNDAVEAMYPMTKTDGSGELLDGSKHDYTLTFAAGQFPPVNSFWSVTMYDGKTQLLIDNPINRYLINSPMLSAMKKNADGSFTIYIQKDAPSNDKKSNWLPAPNGPIYMVMRLYWPKTVPPSILPPGEGTWKPPAVAVAQ